MCWLKLHLLLALSQMLQGTKRVTLRLHDSFNGQRLEAMQFSVLMTNSGHCI